jgi:hypothetical protein
LALPSFQGVIRTTWLPFISALKPQPTPQYAQVVITECSGWPSATTLFSCSVAVGQACTQAPQLTHSLSANGWFLAGRHPRLEAATRDRQREGALRLLAGPHAAVADDALGGVVGEVRVGPVDGQVGVMRAGRAPVP